MFFKMKKIMLLMVVAVFAVTMNAQSVGGGRDDDREVSKGWNTIYAEWNPTTLTFKGDVDNVSLNGFSLGYSRAISLTSSVPIYLETGLAAQFTLKGKTDDPYYFGSIHMISFKVPVNFLYTWNIPNTNVHLIPFLGLNLRGNVWGQYKEEELINWELEDIEYDLFDKHQMGESFVFKRFQVGWQIGLKARFNDRFIVGGSFGTDFTEIAKKNKFRNGTIMLGCSF